MTVQAKEAGQGDTAPAGTIDQAVGDDAGKQGGDARATATNETRNEADAAGGQDERLLLETGADNGDSADDGNGNPETGTEQDGDGGDSGAAGESTVDITWPEGWNEDAEASGALKSFIKEKGLSGEDAQKLAGIHVDMMNRITAEHTKRIRGWENEVRANPEFGGANLKSTVEHAKLVLQKFGSEKLRQDFRQIGYLSHPEFVYMLARIHGKTSEGRSIGGVSQGTPEKSDADILFGD